MFARNLSIVKLQTCLRKETNSKFYKKRLSFKYIHLLYIKTKISLGDEEAAPQLVDTQ